MDTQNNPQAMNVEKKDGTMEPFDRSKVVGACVNAGATNEQAEKCASMVEEWAMGAAMNGSVKSFEIREKVLEMLRMENPAAATAYESYVKGM
jgi:transcriptional regulator NrdR family protein